MPKLILILQPPSQIPQELIQNMTPPALAVALFAENIAKLSRNIAEIRWHIARKMRYIFQTTFTTGETAMSQLVADCPRCGVLNTTFELSKSIRIENNRQGVRWEAFCICNDCHQPTVFEMQNNGKNRIAVCFAGFKPETTKIPFYEYAEIVGYVNTKHFVKHRPLKHVPKDIESAFAEGETCLAVDCFNAAGTMFRLCVDLAITSAFAKELEELNLNERSSLGERIDILFKKNHLPQMLRELSDLIRADGNYGAHKGTLRKINADLLDLTDLLLQHLYTTPEIVVRAKKRRAKPTK